MSKNPVKNSDDRKLLFLFEAILKQKTKKIAIFLILSAKLNRDIKERFNLVQYRIHHNGLKHSEKQVRKFFKKIGLSHRKVGTIPSKADVDKQETFKKNLESLTTGSQRSK